MLLSYVAVEAIDAECRYSIWDIGYSKSMCREQSADGCFAVSLKIATQIATDSLQINRPRCTDMRKSQKKLSILQTILNFEFESWLDLSLVMINPSPSTNIMIIIIMILIF